jgi:hypothetical protein
VITTFGYARRRDLDALALNFPIVDELCGKQ